MISKQKNRIPDGRRLYAIGDIHGRSDLLEELHQKILKDASNASNLFNHIIYLGDYIDRGPCSQQVINLLLHDIPKGFTPTYLLGNHEAMLLDFLETTSSGQNWLCNGGDATLVSYQIDQRILSHAIDYANLQSALKNNLPAAHISFFNSLELSYDCGDYFFCHAGVKPSLPLDTQSKDDLLWIRDEFLYCSTQLEKIIVHGHSISDKVAFYPHRIGVDTGAWFSDRLSALVLEGSEQRVISTGG